MLIIFSLNYTYIYKYIYIIYTPIIFIIVSVNGMVFSGGLLSRLDILLQKFTPYNRHQKNYEQSLLEGIIPTGLKIKETSCVSASFGRF